jgi:carbon monoxide dehydrogenase subunit G
MLQQPERIIKMIRVHESIIVQRPVEEVFAFVADQTNGPRWQSGLLEVRRITDKPIGLGTKHTAVRKFMGRRLEATNEYVVYEPNKEVTFKGDAGSAEFQHSYLTESTAEGTRLTSRMEMESKGLFGLAEPLITRSLRREFAHSLSELKVLLESPAAVAL